MPSVKVDELTHCTLISLGMETFRQHKAVSLLQSSGVLPCVPAASTLAPSSYLRGVTEVSLFNCDVLLISF